jgi:acylphosphatase
VTRCVHFIAHGRVQNVGFRAFTRATARGLSLGGWVRNLPDKTVEGIAEGPSEQVDALLSSLNQGPRFAKVTELESEDRKPYGLSEFEIRY